MENFIIESNNKKIQVNGVELNLLFDDNNFSENMLKLSEAIDRVADAKDIQGINNLSKSINDLFGADTCKNVFGCSNPSAILIYQFLMYINKFIKDFKKKRIDKIAKKYGVERLGEEDV